MKKLFCVLLLSFLILPIFAWEYTFNVGDDFKLKYSGAFILKGNETEYKLSEYNLIKNINNDGDKYYIELTGDGIIVLLEGDIIYDEVGISYKVHLTEETITVEMLTD